MAHLTEVVPDPDVLTPLAPQDLGPILLRLAREVKPLPKMIVEGDVDLAKLAFLAMPLGIRIALKGFPWSRTVRSFSEAAEILGMANCQNLGLAIDSFDIITADIALDELDLVPREQVLLAQLSDFVLHEIRVPGEREATARHFRVFPGEGAHGDALVALITRLEENRYTGDYSFDVYNSDYLEMPPALIAARGRVAADWLGEMVLRRTLEVPNMKRLREVA